MSVSVYEGAIAELEATPNEKDRLRQYVTFYSFETKVARYMNLNGLGEGEAVEAVLRGELEGMRSK